jgi:hypothetical protein
VAPFRKVAASVVEDGAGRRIEARTRDCLAYHNGLRTIELHREIVVRDDGATGGSVIRLPDRLAWDDGALVDLAVRIAIRQELIEAGMLLGTEYIVDDASRDANN